MIDDADADNNDGDVIQVESKQGTEMMERWETIDVDDALELLSRAHTYPAVRLSAVTCLKKVCFSSLRLRMCLYFLLLFVSFSIQFYG